MGNKQGSGQTTRRKRDTLKLLLRISKPSSNGNLLLKLAHSNSNVLELISSFLTPVEFTNLLRVSKGFFHVFHHVSGSYQQECSRLLSLKCDIIRSSKWKILLQNLYCTSLSQVPFQDAIRQVKGNPLGKPLLINYAVELTAFQKSILYFENQSQDCKNLSEMMLLDDARKFAFKNKDILLKLRLGEEINIQMPPLMMLIYNTHEFIQLYLIYINIRLEECCLDHYLALWTHYANWIRVLEDAASPYVQLLNKVLADSLPHHQLPKYSLRHFMVSQWLKQVPEALKHNLRHQFQKRLRECRLKQQKCRTLQQYVLYLIDLSTNQANFGQYGHQDFAYSPEIAQVLKLVEAQTKELYDTDKIKVFADFSLMEFIFGKTLFNIKIFEILFNQKMETIKSQLRLCLSEKQIKRPSLTSEETPTPSDDSQGSQSSLASQIILPPQLPKLLQIYFSPQQLMKTLFASVQQELEQPEEQQCKAEDLQPSGSLENSTISQTSTNASGIFSSFRHKGKEQKLYSYIEQQHQELFQEVWQLLEVQHEIQQRNDQVNGLVENQPWFHKAFDIPELAQYERVMGAKDMKDALETRCERSQVVLQQREEEKFERLVCLGQVSLAQQLMQQNSWY